VADEAERWRDWLRQHGPALLLFARQWSATPSDAEDALQAGFLKFWTTRARARDEAAYLYSCVRSAALDVGRNERRQAARDRNAEPLPQSAFEPPLERLQRHARIESALNQLPGDQREVVVMKIWGELTFAQIGQALGVPLHTAASRYRIALTRLAADLAREMAHE
jgi:RNA polymerase sigma-70 factor (ECF subfamily)